MKTRKSSYFPKQVLKHLAQDICQLIKTNEGRLFILEMIDEIPDDIRQFVLKSLSGFYDPEMVQFFHLLRMEYNNEFESICQRALEKYLMAGIDTASMIHFEGRFLKAYASCSRHSGRISLDVVWDIGNNRVHVESFYLVFNSEGIHSFFIRENLPYKQYEYDRQILANMIEVSFEEACYLISQAYSLNCYYMSRPALGRFLYYKYLNQNTTLTPLQQKALITKLLTKLTPRQLVNSVFIGLNNKDLAYIKSIINEKALSTKDFLELVEKGRIMLEGRVKEVFSSSLSTRVSAYTITMDNDRAVRSDYQFIMGKDKSGTWIINKIITLNKRPIEVQTSLNPLFIRVFCKVYEIIDHNDLFGILDNVTGIKEVQELPYGLHLFITDYDDYLNFGMSVLNGVIADLIINGDEFVVIARQPHTLERLHRVLTQDSCSPVLSRGEYETTLSKAYTYLSGRYFNFEDILVDHNGLQLFEDGMRFISARYLVKNREQLRMFLESLDTINFNLGNNLEVRYQIGRADNKYYFAEYLLSPNCVTLSTYGESDMDVARQHFEEHMYGGLEFDGMEIKHEGVFGVLSPDLRTEYPQLESLLKDIYLNKWYDSRLSILSGMSPSEASKTEEGSRMLWRLFKNMSENKNKKQCTKRRVNLKEYIKLVEQKARDINKY